ncbi:metallophosphoesterase, partial [candidate division KSB1 bacterium]|nr:metallophosphoesterase [candidate division KSB1 bacterium]
MRSRLLSILLPLILISCGTDLRRSSSYRFVQLTDTHISTDESKADLRAVLRTINRLQPAPEFLLVTGDLTDMGWQTELQAFKAIMDSSGFEYYLLLGNHDSRWSGFSQQQLESILGQPSRFCLPWHGVQIVGLNSALPLEAWGDIDGGQVDWLRRTVDKTKPIILSSHHPPIYPGGLYMSENAALFACLDSLPTTLFLVGHGHRYRSWWHNGMAMQMAPAVLRNRAFLMVTLRGDSLHLQHMIADQEQGGQRRALPLLPQDTCWLVIRSMQVSDEALHWTIASSPQLLSAGVRWQIRRNQGPWLDIATPSHAIWTLSD